MCDYLSFCVSLDGERFWFAPDLMSHSGCAAMHNLKPDTFRECEWVGADEQSLRIRVHENDKHDESWLRACVLSQWKTRPDLEAWLIDNIEGARVANRIAKGGDWSTLTGGAWSTLTGGAGATLTGGDGATLTGGDGSTLTGGDRSTLTGGNRSTLTGGDRSTLTGGDGSTLTGGDWSTLTGGDGSVLFWRWQGIVLVVGKGGIKAGKKYVDGKLAGGEQ